MKKRISRNIRIAALCMALAGLGPMCGGTAAAASASPAHLEFAEGDSVRAGKTYHFQNVATGLWLAEGDNWGTHASLDSVGTSLKVVANDTAYAVVTLYGSNYMNSASNGVWMDQSTKGTWFFTRVEGTDLYTISSTAEGTKQLQWTGSGTLVNELAAPSDAARAQWRLVLDSRMIDSIAVATYSQPVDATFLLSDPGFGVSYNGTQAWGGDAPTIGGYRVNTAGTAGGNWCAEQSGQTFESTLEITDMPRGVWGVRMQGFNRQADDSESLNGLFYLGDNYAALPDISTESSQPANLSGAATAFVAGKYATAELRLIVNSGKATVKVVKTQIGGKDWTCWDNLRLTYYGGEVEYSQTFLQEQIDEANALCVTEGITAQAKADLETAVSKADPTKTARLTLQVASQRMVKALSAAKLAIARHNKLATAIAEAQALLDEGGNGTVALAEAIDEAQAALTDEAATDDSLDAARLALRAAITNFGFDNATGSAPAVVTDTRFARGGTMAFGRMTVSGSNIKERGFCYATHPDPAYTDGHSSEYIDNNGRIYIVENLTPGTIYYMRAYAIGSGGAIGYGDAIKVVTLPKANVKFSMRYSDNSDADTRIEAAATKMCAIWNKLTSISGYNSSIGYASGTATADCSYGGWMRVGPNTSYQAPGTILHEWLHGIGVGTHSPWWDANMRANGDRGYWLGERANAALRFWDNDNTAQLNGDDTHMWPYGCNGAHEDTGSNVLYYGGTLIAQGLGEDGLPPTGGFASPAYVFDQEDTIKYCLTCEDETYGQQTAYLTVEADGSLAWKTVDASALDDNYAWYVKFTPSNSYYQLQHAATGRYLTYSNSAFTTALRSTGNAASADNLHLMKGRVDITLADATTARGYALVHPQSSETPPTMTAQAGGAIGSSSFSLANSATSQRWIITPLGQLNPTAISGVEADAQRPATQRGNAIYDLSGRRVTRITQPGIYIVNGQKIKF